MGISAPRHKLFCFEQLYIPSTKNLCGSVYVIINFTNQNLNEITLPRDVLIEFFYNMNGMHVEKCSHAAINVNFIQSSYFDHTFEFVNWAEQNQSNFLHSYLVI